MARNFLDRHFGLIAAILFCVVALFTGILVVQFNNTLSVYKAPEVTQVEVIPTNIIDQPFVTEAIKITPSLPSVTSVPKKYPVNSGNHIAGTTEDVELIASSKNPDDMIAMVRWVIENGEVLEVNISGYVNLGACAGSLKFTKDSVCVDIAKNGPFNPGELLGTVKIKWSDNAKGMIYRLETDGYYDGKTSSFTYQKNNKITVAAGAFGKVAGESLPSSTITFPTFALILISLGSVLVLVAGIGLYMNIQMNKKNTGIESIDAVKRSGQTFQILVIAGLFVLAGGVLYSANWMAMNSTTPEQSKALITSPTPIYVTVKVTQTVTPTDIIIWTSSDIEDTSMITPTVATTPFKTLQVTSTPVSDPVGPPGVSRLPVSDNTPVMCGALDVDNNQALNYLDYNAMLVVYGLACMDSPYAHEGCGGKDTNDDGFIDYQDLYYIMSHYYPNVVNCTRW